MLNIARSDCAIINNRVHHYWQGGMNQLLKRVLNGKRTVRQALTFLDENYTGNSRKAFKHQAFDATSDDTTIELEVLQMLKQAARTGYGGDANLERAFR